MYRLGLTRDLTRTFMRFPITVTQRLDEGQQSFTDSIKIIYDFSVVRKKKLCVALESSSSSQLANWFCLARNLTELKSQS